MDSYEPWSKSLCTTDRPKEHKSDSGGSVWGQSRLHMQVGLIYKSFYVLQESD